MKDALSQSMESPFSLGFVVTMAGSIIILAVIVILGYRATRLDQLHEDVRKVQDVGEKNRQAIQRLEGK